MEQEIEKACSRKTFVARLRRLATALERGERFAIQVAGRRIVVPREAVVGIAHEREGDIDEIEFQLTWQTVRRRQPKASP